MNRDEAWALLNEYTKSESLLKHALAVEAAMWHYAAKLGEDAEKWGVTGLLHDFDYERWPDIPDHTQEGAKSCAGAASMKRSSGRSSRMRNGTKSTTRSTGRFARHCLPSMNFAASSSR